MFTKLVKSLKGKVLLLIARKANINKKLIKLTELIESKKIEADGARDGLTALALYESREQDIKTLIELVRISYVVKSATTENVTHIDAHRRYNPLKTVELVAKAARAS